MKKNLTLMALAILAVAGLTACDEKKTTEQTSEQTTPDGTTIEKSTTVETTTDGEGNAKQEVKTETSVDPAGVMNKETTESTETHETKTSE